MVSNIFLIIILVTYLGLMLREIKWFLLEKKRLLYLRAVEHFLGEIRHYYYIHGMVDEAVYEVLPILQGKMLATATDIYDLLESKDLEEEVYKFNERESNRFIRTFLALCISVLQYGDKLINNESLFLTNLKNLRQEIGIEVLKREKINYLFSGLMILILLPGCFLRIIETWGMNNLGELESYYRGSYGMIAMGIIYIITLITYALVGELRELKEAKVLTHPVLSRLTELPMISPLLDSWEDRNYGKYIMRQELLRSVGESITPRQFLLKQCLYAISILIAFSIFFGSVHINMKRYLINSTFNAGSITSSLSDRQVQQIQEHVLYYTNQLKKEQLNSEELFKRIQAQTGITNRGVVTMITEEVDRRLIAYRGETFRWWELLVQVVAGLFAYHAPMFYLQYKKRVRRMGMEDEVIQFHSIILMLMYMDRMTVDTMLEWMEQFANLFRRSLQECINEFSGGEAEALLMLKEKEPFLMFQRLVENLMISDQIGIAQAFDEIAVDRVSYQERRKQENEIYITNKSLLGKLIAYIPLVLVLGLYLILPFIFESIHQLVGFMSEIQKM